MHVTHIVRQFHPVIGGLEEMVANLATTLTSNEGIDCSIVSLDRDFRDLDTVLPTDDEYKGIPIRRIPYKGSSRYPLAPSVIKEIDQANIVHVHAIDFFYDYLPLTKILHRKPLVASTHGGFFHTPYASGMKKFYFNSITRMSSAAYDKVIASSENDKEIFGKITPRNLTLIENGVDIQKFWDASSSAKVPTAIYIGRFSQNKNLGKLTELFAELKQRKADWKLIIAGREADMSRSQLDEIIRVRDLQDNVRVETNLSVPELRLLIGEASYVISLSEFEGFGISIIEGMSAGLTPVLSGIPPFKNLVANTGRGLIVDSNDLGRSADAMIAFDSMQSESVRLQNMDASKLFGWGGVAAQFAAVYREVMEKAA